MKFLPLILLLILIGCNKEPDFTLKNGTFIDTRDKLEYKWVKIGEQVWMAENIAYLPAIYPSKDGSESEPRYYVFDFQDRIVNEAKSKPNYLTYGVLYNWQAAKTVCPSGWHLSSDEEWKTLEIYLGMSQADADKEHYRDSGSVGKALKSTSGWSENGNGDNSSGFSAFPSGNKCMEGNFTLLGYYTIFWSFSQVIAAEYWCRALGYAGDMGVHRDISNRIMGHSVRCIKD